MTKWHVEAVHLAQMEKVTEGSVKKLMDSGVPPSDIFYLILREEKFRPSRYSTFGIKFLFYTYSFMSKMKDSKEFLAMWGHDYRKIFAWANKIDQEDHQFVFYLHTKEIGDAYASAAECLVKAHIVQGVPLKEALQAMMTDDPIPQIQKKV